MNFRGVFGWESPYGRVIISSLQIISFGCKITGRESRPEYKAGGGAIRSVGRNC